VSRRRIRKRRHLVGEFAAKIERIGRWYDAFLTHALEEQWARTYFGDQPTPHAAVVRDGVLYALEEQWARTYPGVWRDECEEPGNG